MTARWLNIAVVLGLASAALLLIFGDEARTAVQTWIDSTAYGHCFFVIPIAAFLAWERRTVILATPLRPLPFVALAVLPIGVAWLAVERVGIMEGQQLTAFAAFQVMALACLGWRLYRACAVPLLYLVFLVPFGAFITPILQNFTAHFIDIGLDILSIPHFSDGNIVEIPAGRFFVAEACAGLRFLIASIAFGALYACMIYRSPVRRITFIVASVVIPVVANGFRALGIVVLGDILGSAEAAAVDHVLYGWIFFSVVILLLIAAGLPFREDGMALEVPPAAPDSPHAPRKLALAALLSVVLIAVAPVWRNWAERDGYDAATLAALEPGAVIGCLPMSDAGPVAPGASAWVYSCPMSAGPIDHLVLRVDRLPPHSNAGALPRQRRAVTGEFDAESSDVRTFVDRPDLFWQLVQTTEPDRMVAVAGWVDGTPARGGMAQRLARARHSVAATAPAPLLISLSTPPDIKAISSGQAQEVQHAMTGLLQRNAGFVAELAGKAP